MDFAPMDERQNERRDGPAHPKDALEGVVIDDRYRIESRLGAGGMGEVYRARDVRSDRDVVVKRVRHPSDRERALLLREARLLSRLQEQTAAVVAQHDFIVQRGEIFLVLELIEGEPLDEWLLRHATRQETLTTYAALAAALAEIHDAGVVHRDLKPANVFVHGDPGDPIVKVMDFGLAVCIGEEDDLTGVATMVVGTPSYMSPEMLHGDPATTAIDVFALGVMLYESLTATTPWSGETMALRLSRQARELPRLDLIERPGDRRLLAEMLSSDPAARPAAAQVAAALDRRARLDTDSTVRVSPVDDGATATLEPALGRPAESSPPPEPSMTLARRPPPTLAAETIGTSRPESTRIAAAVGRGAPSLGRRWLPLVLLAIVVIAFVVALWKERTLPPTVLFGALSATFVLVGAGFLVRRRGRRLFRKALSSSSLLDTRIQALERRLDSLKEVTQSVAVQLQNLSPQLALSAMAEVMGQTAVGLVRQPYAGMPASVVARLLHGVQPGGVSPKEEKKASWYKRISDCLTLTGVAVGCAGGVIGVVSSLWTPNKPPVIEKIQTDNDKAPRFLPGQSLQIIVHAKDDDSSIRPTVTIESEDCIVTPDPRNSAIAILKPGEGTGPDGKPRRAFLVTIGATDGEKKVTESLWIRMHERPKLEIIPSQPSVLAGATLQLDVSLARHPLGDTMKFHWRPRAGVVTPRVSELRTTTFTAPERSGVVEIGCSVSDDYGTWQLDPVTIEVHPRE